MSHVFGRLLEKQGYQVNYLSQPADSQWFMLSSGNADLQVEVWEGSMADKFNALTDRGLIVDAGTHAALTREEWWFPAYVQKDCPGLPDWKSLNDCVGLFTDQDDTVGVYYTGPWEKPDRARIRALDLPYRVITLPDSDAIRERMEQAIQTREPLLIFNWTPNWVEAVYPGLFVEFPEYQPACESDPQWGINPDLTWDCGNPKDGWMKKATSLQLARSQPCALHTIRQISMDNHHIAEAAALVEVEGLSVQQAADKWLINNQSVWQEWLHQSACSASDDPIRVN